MSHTFSYGRGFFRYNSDLSGDVEVEDYSGARVRIPGRALLEFVARYVAQERISELEQASVEEILGLPEL